jgi:hypothetical protein
VQLLRRNDLLRSSRDGRLAKAEIRAILPHAMHDDRKFTYDRNACFLCADALYSDTPRAL